MPTTVANIISLWEKYAKEDFHELSGVSADGEARVLCALAGLERGEPMPPELALDGSTFENLARGMEAYHAGDYSQATALLYAHLHEKEYFSEWILDRFLRCAEASANYKELYTIASKYSSWPGYQEKLAGPLFYSAHALGNHARALKTFEEHHRILSTTDVLFKVACSLIALKEYRRAEALLLKLYQKITGRSYDPDFKALESTYAPLIARLPDLMKKQLSPKESWQVGMACIVNRDYDKALSIFKTLVAA
ncbi:MAG: hypothetical protein HS115_09760 [Spirochaetales bacterium]|nr:hypothetical protein [Spirochaetales bacterium]